MNCITEKNIENSSNPSLFRRFLLLLVLLLLLLLLLLLPLLLLLFSCFTAVVIFFVFIFSISGCCFWLCNLSPIICTSCKTVFLCRLKHDGSSFAAFCFPSIVLRCVSSGFSPCLPSNFYSISVLHQHLRHLQLFNGQQLEFLQHADCFQHHLFCVRARFPSSLKFLYFFERLLISMVLMNSQQMYRRTQRQGCNILSTTHCCSTNATALHFEASMDSHLTFPVRSDECEVLEKCFCYTPRIHPVPKRKQ